MSGITPYLTIQKIAGRINDLDTFDEVNDALDEVEYLFEVIPPELQDPVETLIAQLRARLKQLDGT